MCCRYTIKPIMRWYMKNTKRMICILTCIFIVLTSVCGCTSSQGSVKTTEPVEPFSTETSDVPATDETKEEAEKQNDSAQDNAVNVDEDPTVTVEEEKLSDEQLNSITMLNYLAAVSEGIRTADNNILFLEDAYSSLKDNLNPNSVSKRTQEHVTALMESISDLRLDEKEREHVQLIFDQSKANAIRNVVPSPLAILNIVESGSPLKELVSVTSLVLSSVSNYKGTVSQSEQDFLNSNWEIDKTKMKYLDNASSDAFNYLMDIVRENNLPGEYSLNDNAIKELTEMKKNTNTARVIQFLEANEETYKYYYEYWLYLAENYYKHGDYDKCLNAFNSYESLNVKIFRKNTELARVLPDVIYSAEVVLSGQELITREEQYAKLLLENSDTSNWELKYYAVQTYLNLFSKTNEEKYLKEAYTQTLSIVNSLIDKQLTLNNQYLSDLDLINTDGLKGEEKTNAKKYNALLKDTRKTELPPIYDPLLINCQLLFSIAEKLNISDNDKKNIDNILHENGDNLFLVDSIDSLFWCAENKDPIYVIDFDGTKLTLSANTLTNNSSIKVSLNDKDSTVINDWTINNVKRKGDYAEQFVVICVSKEIKKVKYSDGMKVTIEIHPFNGLDSTISEIYNVKSKRFLLFFNHYEFKKTD